MAEIKIKIPDKNLNMVLIAFAEQRGIEATIEAVQKEFAEEIRQVVAQSEGKKAATLAKASLSDIQ